MKRTFTIKACWNDEAKIWYSESDIKGLHIEAKTLEEFEDIMMDTARELIMANHISLQDFTAKPISDLIPGIVWQRPSQEMACA